MADGYDFSRWAPSADSRQASGDDESFFTWAFAESAHGVANDALPLGEGDATLASMALAESSVHQRKPQSKRARDFAKDGKAEAAGAPRKAKKARGGISFETAHRLLSTRPAGLPEILPRPHRLLQSPLWDHKTLSREGALFLDDGSRREADGDRWVLMGGPRGTSKSEIFGIKRSYGSLKLHKSSIQVRFHVYTKLSAVDCVGQPATQKKLWHVLPDVQTHKVAAGANTDKRTIQLPATHGSSFIQVERPLRLWQRKQGWPSTYLDFENSQGQWQGAIGQSANGAKFISKSGDFAEWFRRRPDEPAFEAGDVIGFDADGLLTRRISSLSCSQLGIISRIAAVEGSVPDGASRKEYDVVAFAGVVPVKLRGNCHAGQYIVPSGREDGTAAALSPFSAAWLDMVCCSRANPYVRIGRAAQSARAATMSEGESMSLGRCLRRRPVCHEPPGADWRFVKVSVVSPVDTIAYSRAWGGWVLVILGLTVGYAIGVGTMGKEDFLTRLACLSC